MKLTLRDIVQATGGKLLNGNPDDRVTGVSTDSRTVRKGDLFFALRGVHHDGHKFVGEVFRKGAAAAVVDSREKAGKNVIRVPDTMKALGDLAHVWRRRFAVPVVAVTGSNGKTTTKEMIARILERRLRVLKTEGNFNNLIGLPLTLLRLDRKAEVGVVEMGMNRVGEIDRLAEIASPRIGVITNVARAHLEGLGGLVRIARAKGELLRRLPREGAAVLNADDPSFGILRELAPCRIVPFGRKQGASVRLLSFRPRGFRGSRFRARVGRREADFTLPVPGRQNVANALAALAVGDQFGIPIGEMKKALAGFRTASRRMEVVSLPKKIDLIDDCYNANPDSIVAALEFLKEVGGDRRRVAILGEMLELGPYALRCHREIGAVAARAKIDLLFAMGEHAGALVRAAKKGGLSSSFAFETVEQSLPFLRLLPGDLVLVKGSRGMKMERVVLELKNAL